MFNSASAQHYKGELRGNLADLQQSAMHLSNEARQFWAFGTHADSHLRLQRSVRFEIAWWLAAALYPQSTTRSRVLSPRRGVIHVPRHMSMENSATRESERCLLRRLPPQADLLAESPRQIGVHRPRIDQDRSQESCDRGSIGDSKAHSAQIVELYMLDGSGCSIPYSCAREGQRPKGQHK